jgi:hypothetical protein
MTRNSTVWDALHDHCEGMDHLAGRLSMTDVTCRRSRGVWLTHDQKPIKWPDRRWPEGTEHPPEGAPHRPPMRWDACQLLAARTRCTNQKPLIDSTCSSLPVAGGSLHASYPNSLLWSLHRPIVDIFHFPSQFSFSMPKFNLKVPFQSVAI